MDAKILLPVRPHVLRYLVHTVGPLLEVSNRGYAPFLLFNILEKHKKADPATVRPSQKLIDDKNFVAYPIYLGVNIVSSKGTFISTDNIKKFNDAIDDLIKEEMYRYCNHHNAPDSKVDYNILRFRESYGITEDDLPFDNLKRWYYRERIRIQERLSYAPEIKPQLTLTF